MADEVTELEHELRWTAEAVGRSDAGQHHAEVVELAAAEIRRLRAHISRLEQADRRAMDFIAHSMGRHRDLDLDLVSYSWLNLAYATLAIAVEPELEMEL